MSKERKKHTGTDCFEELKQILQGKIKSEESETLKGLTKRDEKTLQSMCDSVMAGKDNEVLIFWQDYLNMKCLEILKQLEAVEKEIFKNTTYLDDKAQAMIKVYCILAKFFIKKIFDEYAVEVGSAMLSFIKEHKENYEREQRKLSTRLKKWLRI